jgi:spore germination protein KA
MKIEELLNEHFQKDLDTNIEKVTFILGENVDFVKKELVIHLHHPIRAVFVYTDGLTNKSQIENLIDAFQYKTQQLEWNIQETDEKLAAKIMKHIFLNPSTKLISTMQEGIDGVLSGDCLCFIENSDQVISISARGWDTRSVDEPQTEQVVRGPRDGFTESIRTNTSLVRRRIRDPLLRVEGMQIGKKSKTDVNIIYIKGTVKEGLVEEVKERLHKIKIDAVLESGYIEELIEDAPLSPFTTIQSTERPDKVAAAVLEGRVAIFIDNSPFVLIVPTYFWQFFQASEDYYSRFMSGSFFRIIRYFAFIISLVLPSIYVMLVSFHQEMIPTGLALTIASGREVVPFPVLIEALMMEVAFELMREAGLRMPKPVGQAVSIVGSLVIGQAAVQAGVVSPFMVIIVALTGISSFTIPNYAASFSIRLVRFPLLIASGTLGLLGFAVMFTIIAIHAMTLRSFGESYLAPATPFQPSDQKDTIIRFPWWKMDRQPQLAEGIDYRAGDTQMPRPPGDHKIFEDPNTDEEPSKKQSSRSKREVRSLIRRKDK